MHNYPEIVFAIITEKQIRYVYGFFGDSDSPIREEDFKKDPVKKYLSTDFIRSFKDDHLFGPKCDPPK